MPKPTPLHETYEAFLESAIKVFWDSEASTKLDAIALLLAGGEAWKVAFNNASGNPGALLKGAAGVAGVTLVLRRVLGGPVGLILTGLSVGSAVALYSKYHERIWTQVERYKSLVDEYRPKYAAIAEDFEAGSISAEQRDLMLEGLMARFGQRLEGLPHVIDDVS